MGTRILRFLQGYSFDQNGLEYLPELSPDKRASLSREGWNYLGKFADSIAIIDANAVILQEGSPTTVSLYKLTFIASALEYCHINRKHEGIPIEVSLQYLLDNHVKSHDLPYFRYRVINEGLISVNYSLFESESRMICTNHSFAFYHQRDLEAIRQIFPRLSFLEFT